MIPLHDDNPTLNRPILTIVLIVMNVLIFLWQNQGDQLAFQRKVFKHSTIPHNITSDDSGEAAMLITRPRVAIHYGISEDGDDFRSVDGRTLDPRTPLTDFEIVTQPRPWWLTLFSAMFMHGGWMHLIGNMWFLWIFGNNIEDACGKLRFIAFYLVGGLAATAGHIFSDSSSLVPSLGASGAISAVLGGYLLLYPRARVFSLIPLGYIMTTFQMPAMVFLPIWLGMQFLSVFAQSSGVAWWAHIIGFVAGLALIKLYESGEHRRRPRQERWKPSPRLRRRFR